MSSKIILAIILVSFLQSGCVLLNRQFYTDELWQTEKISQDNVQYSGSVSKITIGNLRPTIPGKSAKLLDKKYDIGIQLEINNQQSQKKLANYQNFDLVRNSKWLVITCRATNQDENGTRRIIKNLKNFPLDSVKIYIEHQNDKEKIELRMCSKERDYCIDFPKSRSDDELRLTQQYEAHKDDVIMLDHAISLEIKESFVLYKKNDGTFWKILATPFTLFLDVLNLPLLVLLIIFS